MTRVPYATRDTMDAHGQEIWDDIDTCLLYTSDAADE